jgi:hypothetical protein
MQDFLYYEDLSEKHSATSSTHFLFSECFSEEVLWKDSSSTSMSAHPWALSSDEPTGAGESSWEYNPKMSCVWSYPPLSGETQDMKEMEVTLKKVSSLMIRNRRKTRKWWNLHEPYSGCCVTVSQSLIGEIFTGQLTNDWLTVTHHSLIFSVESLIRVKRHAIPRWISSSVNRRYIL